MICDCLQFELCGVLTNCLCLTRRAYRAFYILNWIYRYITEARFSRWIGKPYHELKRTDSCMTSDCMYICSDFQFAIADFSACVSGIVQTALYADFFYYYFIRYGNLSY